MHIRPILTFLLLTVGLFSLPAAAQEPDSLPDAPASETVQPDPIKPWGEALSYKLNDLLTDPMFSTSQIGLCVYDLTADSLVFAHGERQVLRPASTMKVLTAIAALHTLGAAHRFETALYYEGDIKDSVLVGDLYVVGGMDPLFGRDDMQAFVQALQNKGIKQIDGMLYADVTLKDTLQWGWGWCWDDDAPILTPLLYNGKNTFMDNFRRMAFDAGIMLPESYTLRQVPPLAALIERRFHSMDQVLMPMMKRSDNLFAEAMFYQLGASVRRPYAPSATSAKVMGQWIKTLGNYDQTDFEVADGSGLSLYNYVSARLLVDALRFAYKQSEIITHLRPSMPIAGHDGTLAGRMKGTTADYRVFAKTGTVEGVSSLAGYATASNGNQLAFAIINQGIRRTAPGRAFQNKVCVALTE